MKATFRPLRMELWQGEPTRPSQRRSRYTFKAPWYETLAALNTELTKLGAKEVVIEADFRESDIRLDGMPRANARVPQFPGVRIAFESKHGPLVYQADNCAFWQHNVRSIALGLEALRAVDRYGITSRAEQYTGWRAIESGTPMGSSLAKVEDRFPTVDSALEFLCSERIAGFAGASGLTPKALWRHVARHSHPDVGGHPDEWQDILAAKEVLEKAGRL